MHFRPAEPHFVCVVVARFDDATQYVAQLGFIVDKPQQRLALRALHANAKDVLRGRIEVDDQKAVVEKNDA